MTTQDQQNDVELIRTGDLLTAIEAAKRIAGYDYPVDQQLITDLGTILVDRQNSVQSRIAAAYALGWIDQEGSTESVHWTIACNPEESLEVRDYAEEALYYFAQNRRRQQTDTEATSYQDQSFAEWRKSQEGVLRAGPGQAPSQLLPREETK